jgi:hypothetical protein
MILPGWTKVPHLNVRTGFESKGTTCVGCLAPLPPGEPNQTCVFCYSGFFLEGIHFHPCYTRYHSNCIRVRLPFHSRLSKHGGGLVYPSAMANFPFICEGYTVRSVLRRELTPVLMDWQLLCYERMCMIDAAHARAPATMSGIQQQLCKLAVFGMTYGITLCHAPSLSHPPNSSIIPILWAISAYTNQVSSSPHCLPNEDNHITYNTAWSLQSAALAYYQWCRMLQYPDVTYQDCE